jgi:hypothetical protein
MKYRRFKRTCTSDQDVQSFLDDISSGGWRIIYYAEDSHNQSGDSPMYLHLTAVGEMQMVRNVL